MTSAIDSSFITTAPVDKAPFKLALDTAASEITALQSGKVGTTGDNTVTGNLTISKADPTLILNKAAAGQSNYISGRSAGSARWGINIGAPSTSDLSIDRYSDAGSFVDAPLTIVRATGAPTFANAGLWRTGLGGTTVGNAVFTATDAPAARTAINAPAIPTATAGVAGDWRAITSDGSGNYSLPAGGTWAYFWSANFGAVSVAAGGTALFTGDVPIITRGFAWRIA